MIKFKMTPFMKLLPADVKAWGWRELTKLKSVFREVAVVSVQNGGNLTQQCLL